MKRIKTEQSMLALFLILSVSGASAKSIVAGSNSVFTPSTDVGIYSAAGQAALNKMQTAGAATYADTSSLNVAISSTALANQQVQTWNPPATTGIPDINAMNAEAAAAAQKQSLIAGMMAPCAMIAEKLFSNNEPASKTQKSAHEIYASARREAGFADEVDVPGMYREDANSTPYSPMPILSCNDSGPASPGTAGKITHYGYEAPGDKYYDTNSGNGIGATKVPLAKGDCALSRDMEAASGAKLGQTISIQFADGTSALCRFNDRTADIYKGTPIRGRVDLYAPFGISSTGIPDDKKISGIRVCNK